jgi:hypothetical protein
LRKRAARKIDLFADDLSVIPESVVPTSSQIDAPESSQVQQPISQRSEAKDSQDSQSLGAETGVGCQERGTWTRADRQTMALGKSRLKRRAATAGTQTQSQFNFGFDDAFDIDRKAEAAAAEIQEVYEQTKAAAGPPPAKRQRTTTRATSEAMSNTEGMQVDEPDEAVEEVEDPMQSMLRKAREAQTQQASTRRTQSSMPPPPPRQTRARAPSEEAKEAVEPVWTSKKSKTQKEAAKTGESEVGHPDQDPQFLTAISKAKKTKSAMDELDKEFNDLRIPKLREKDVVPASSMRYDHPDWNLVDDFDDEMRGNFIQVVKKDLFRKDLGRKEPVRVDDGRPNFKKFKKASVWGYLQLRFIVADWAEERRAKRTSEDDLGCSELGRRRDGRT